MTADLIEKTCGKYYSKHWQNDFMWKADCFSSSGQNVPKEPVCVCLCALSISRRADGLGVTGPNGQCLVHIMWVSLS